MNLTITIPTMRTSNVKDKFVYEDFLQLQKWKQSSLKMKNYAEHNPINRKSKSSKFKYFWFVQMLKRFLKFVKMIKIQIFWWAFGNFSEKSSNCFKKIKNLILKFMRFSVIFIDGISTSKFKDFWKFVKMANQFFIAEVGNRSKPSKFNF